MPLSRSNCLFIHIPKCAGTSVEVALGIADEYPEIGLKVTSTKPNITSLFGGGLQHLTIREVRHKFPEVMTKPGLFSFSIIRDPIDRFVSHFLWKHYRFLDSELDDMTALKALSVEVEELVAVSRSLDVFNWPFDGLEYCEGDPQTVLINDVKRHLVPQCSYLFDHDIVPIDAIYPIEEMSAVQRDLRQRDANMAPIPHRMAGRKTNSLRQMIPANLQRAIEDIYRHDLRLHQHLRETTAVKRRGFFPGAAIDLTKLAVASTKPPRRMPANTLLGSRVPRQLWMYWHQGWDKAPEIVQNCVKSWTERNPSWKVRLLTAENLADAIKIPDFYINRLALPIPALSDVVRLHLLCQHGGVWADATTWCVRPLDEWLEKVLAGTEFFAYAKPAPDRPISTWFLAAAPHHPIIERLRTSADDLWKNAADGLITLDVSEDPNSKNYFWLHSLFADLLATDPMMAELWGRCWQIKADAPHYLQDAGLLSVISVEIEFHIRNKLANVYKLNRRFELPSRYDGTALSALFKTL